MMRVFAGAAGVALALVCLRPADASHAPAGVRGTGAPVPFHISSLGSTYPLKGEFRGTYDVFPDSVVVLLSSGRMRSGIPANIGERGTLTRLFVSAGLGRPLDGPRGGWTTDSLSERTVVLQQLRGEQEGPVPPLRLVVPRVAGTDVSRQWLIIQVGAHHDRLFRTSADIVVNYVCQESNLMGATDESRARSRRMAKNYSTHC